LVVVQIDKEIVKEIENDILEVLKIAHRIELVDRESVEFGVELVDVMNDVMGKRRALRLQHVYVRNYVEKGCRFGLVKETAERLKSELYPELESCN
jgi:hypothetical protein